MIWLNATLIKGTIGNKANGKKSKTYFITGALGASGYLVSRIIDKFTYDNNNVKILLIILSGFFLMYLFGIIASGTMIKYFLMRKYLDLIEYERIPVKKSISKTKI